MSTQSKTMPVFDLKMYVRVVAAIFSLSSATAFVMALLRLLNPDLYYVNSLDQKLTLIHYFVTGLMIITSAVGFLNSFVVLVRNASSNTGRNITTWLLLDSLFETSRVVYVFMCEAVIKGKGTLQLYELSVSPKSCFKIRDMVPAAEIFISRDWLLCLVVIALPKYWTVFSTAK